MRIVIHSAENGWVLRVRYATVVKTFVYPKFTRVLNMLRKLVADEGMR